MKAWRALGRILATAALLGGLCAVVRAQQPTVKDLLGKAQTQSETKAVQDLINKLERRQPTPPKSEPASTPSSAAPPASSEQTAVQQPAPKIAPPATREVLPKSPSNEPSPSGSQAAAEQPAPTPEPPAVKPEASKAVEPGTDATRDLPSVELEVVFEYRSARVTPAAIATLTPLGRALTDPRLADDFFLIAGHTDAKGNPEYNVRLSQQRADAVRDFLVKQFKVDARRLVARGFGDRRLKDPQNPFDEKNRRVQVINFTPPRAH